jgi:hypothetical protein
MGVGRTFRCGGSAMSPATTAAEAAKPARGYVVHEYKEIYSRILRDTRARDQIMASLVKRCCDKKPRGKVTSVVKRKR